MRPHSLVLALVLPALLALGGDPVGAADTAREAVGKPVEMAQLLIKQKKYKEALAKLHEADLVRDKTHYEQYVIDDTRAAVLIASGDDAAAAASLEAALASGALTSAERLRHVQSLMQLEFRLKNYAKLIEDGERYLHEGGNDEAALQLLAQAYYLQGDFADAAKTAHTLLSAERQGGRPASEALLQLLANSEYQAKDQPGYIDALEQLLKVQPRKEYWASVLAAVRRKAGFAERLTLDLNRLRLATGTLDKPADYIDAAERALIENLPGDAKAVLDQGYATGVLGIGAAAERQQRLRDMADQQAAEDSAHLAQAATAADTAGDASAALKLGDAYASHARYDQAIATYRKALGDAGLKYPDLVRLRLGVVYLAAGQPQHARDVLDAIESDDGTRDLALLWLIQSGTAADADAAEKP